MKIGILKETKHPIDNRVILTPDQISELIKNHPEVSFKVQKSDIRAFSDEEYRAKGIEVAEDISDCDVLMGIKEADISTILPDKHYIFFGHIAKKQPYNIPLFKTLLEKNTTFSDYEYLVDEKGLRVIAFGWFAGFAGTYYTLQGWGKCTGEFELPKPHLKITAEEMIQNVKDSGLKGVKIVLTGSGRVSHGAQYLLENIGAVKVSPAEFLKMEARDNVLYTVLPIEEMVAPNDSDSEFSFEDFVKNPQNYHSIFAPYAKGADILISCHFWSPGQPVYLTEEAYLEDGFRIKVIGDITCDIQGSIKSTLDASTHADPFYDYNPRTRKMESPFGDAKNVTVMAVDTCPNALPRMASESFGDQFIRNVFKDLVEEDTNPDSILKKATIIRTGQLTDEFGYLKEYVEEFMKK